MMLTSVKPVFVTATCMVLLAACGSERTQRITTEDVLVGPTSTNTSTSEGGSLFDIFKDPGNDVKVNRFLWTASLQVLDFLPVQNADPFTGVISTGFGRPPGGNQVYRATILISDPALDARSLNVALQTRGGAAVSTATQRAVEDAILTRARQLRVEAKGF